ncbi:uncharacterized protein FFNC_15636 [Fusarium fujikuroi]|nr:uncharacterized protein FFNC_15636 [Fusarium fujikuroi]
MDAVALHDEPSDAAHEATTQALSADPRLSLVKNKLRTLSYKKLPNSADDSL